MLSFRRPLPLIQGGLETLWGDLTFCHQADYVSCGFHPSSEKKQAVCHCIKAFFSFSWVSKNWTTEGRCRHYENYYHLSKNGNKSWILEILKA